MRPIDIAVIRQKTAAWNLERLNACGAFAVELVQEKIEATGMVMAGRYRGSVEFVVDARHASGPVPVASEYSAVFGNTTQMVRTPEERQVLDLS